MWAGLHASPTAAAMQQLALMAAPVQWDGHAVAGRRLKVLTRRQTLRHWRAAQVSKAALTAVRLQDNGRTMAVGAGDGSTTVLRLSAGLADMQANEKPAFLAVTMPKPKHTSHANTVPLQHCSLTAHLCQQLPLSCQLGAGQPPVQVQCSVSPPHCST